MDKEMAVRILNGEVLATPKQNYEAISMALIAFCGTCRLVSCKKCLFWRRERISCEGYARCMTGEGGLRYRREYDFCSKGIRIKESEDED